MSRAQQGQVFQTGQTENKNYTSLANSSYNQAQGDINSYGSAVGAFKAANPYVQGGAVETAENQQLADSAAGLARAGGQAIQGAGVRTGANTGGAIAATEQMEEAGQRNLATEQAGATERRAAAGAGYGREVLGAEGTQADMEAKLAGQESGAAQSAFTTEEKAAETPSFLEELGQGIIKTGENFASGVGKGVGMGIGAAALA